MTQAPIPAAPPPAAHSRAQRLLAPPLMGGVLLLLLVGAFILLGRLWWMGDVLASFRAFGFVAGLLAAAMLIPLRAPRWAAAALVGAAVHGAPLLAYARPSPAEPADGPALSVLSFNTWTGNAEPQAVLALIEAEDPDLIAIFELSTPMAAALQAQAAQRPYVILDPSDLDNFGIGLYSRFPVDGAGLLKAGAVSPGSMPAIDVSVHRPGAAPLRVLLAHPMPPVGAESAARRDRQLRAMAALARLASGPTLLMGDFNLSPLSPSWGPLLEASGLVDCRRVQGGLTGSWPTYWPAWLRIPIDHAWVSPDIGVQRLAVGAPAGSDHLPLHLDLGLPTQGTPE